MNRHSIFGTLIIFLLSFLCIGHTKEDMYPSAMEFLDFQGEIRLVDFMRQGLTVIMVFNDFCLTCNKNIPIWNKISSLSGVHAVGITYQLQGDTDDVLRFPLLKPMNISAFKSLFQLRDGVDYTIALKDGVVVFTQIGQLSPSEYYSFKNNVVNK